MHLAPPWEKLHKKFRGLTYTHITTFGGSPYFIVKTFMVLCTDI